ncbi:spore germination protein KC [Tumebacillus sp. BK434]|uniref:Ger(x)C family spore germination protein n=1 Tax=Tumebacillus sp. BK434 TaxID=2512169 RepID=UPI0010EA761C|nr:Ger(x)C family spore germination protein [Tumebacillus sp. BK434]TCP52832.1 spore germination protein KC [Tumebacillus sp. BK434]
MKRPKRILPLMLIVCLAAVLLTGCWDRKELEQRTSVVAMAIDLAEMKAGERPKIKLSVQIPIPIKIAGSGGGGGEGGKSAVKVMSATGLSMADAMRNLQQRLNQELFYGHTRVIAVSERVAGIDMSGIVDSLRRSPQMRRLLWVLITPGQAVELLQADPKLEQIPIVFVMDLIENGAKRGRIPDITLGRWFIDRSSSGIQPTANIVQSNKQDIKWRGLALFHDDQMVGKLNDEESWVLLNIKDKAIGGDITIPCPYAQNGADGSERKYITVHPKKVHVKNKIEPVQDTFRMNVSIMLELDVVESMCDLDYRKKEVVKLIESAISEELNKRARKLVALCQKEYRVDVFGMGNKVRAKYPREFESKNWSDEFPKTQINIDYEVEVRRVGMKMR